MRPGRGCYQPRVGSEAEVDTSAGGLRRWAPTLVKIGVSVLAVAVLAQRVDTAEIARGMAAAPPLGLAAVLALYLLTQLVTAYRWYRITSALGLRVPLGPVVTTYFVGMFFNLFGPSTLGGDVVRTLAVVSDGESRATAAWSVFADRWVGLTMLATLAVVALAVFGDFGLPAPLVWTAVGAAAAALAAPWVVGFVPILNRSSFYLSYERHLRALVSNRLLLAEVAALSVGFHLAQIATVVVLAGSIGLEIDWRYAVVFHPLVTIATGVPVSVAGVGVRELGYAYFLERVGVAPEAAVAFALLWFAVLVVSSLVGGVVYLWSGVTIGTAGGAVGDGR